MKVKVLYEDSNVLAIDKPAGVLTHPDGRTKEVAITDLLLKKYPKIELVHRLDKDTSGVLLFAKNKKAHEFLKNQFSAPAIEIKQRVGLADRQSRVKKVYHAIVSGFVKNDHGIINKPIGRSPSDFRRRLSGRGAPPAMPEAITK